MRFVMFGSPIPAFNQGVYVAQLSRDNTVVIIAEEKHVAVMADNQAVCRQALEHLPTTYFEWMKDVKTNDTQYYDLAEVEAKAWLRRLGQAKNLSSSAPVVAA